MEIQILGPVGLRLNGHWLTLGSDKERVLLAALALDAGRPVAISELMERLWDGDPPARARENAHTYVSRIRRRLRVAGTGPDAPAVVGRAHTYTLRIRRDSVDRQRFQRFVDAALSSGDDARAVDLLSRAEKLWQGEALAGLPGFWAATVRRTLAESRLNASTSRLAAGLRLGRFAEQVGELSSLAEQHPGDETLLGQLMLAYYGSGRYADALRVHQRARQSLMAEYGALPGAELDMIHQGVLARVPARELANGNGRERISLPPAAVVGDPPTPAPEVPEPARLPPDVPPPRNLPQQPALVGRRSELRALTSMIAEKGAPGGSVVTVEAVSGMAGVGKTALAVATAHLLAQSYPDGQLYIDLRGHSPSQEPLTARAALATLLRLLGAPAFSIPAELEGRTALWRTMLAERRVVIVLDDASGPEQVAPLLPSGSPSLTIIASRRHLTGIPQALAVPLDALPEEDAISLFRGFAGEERTRDLAETARIVGLCGYLPLAIELVAHRFRARTSWTLTVLAERLARSPGRLTEIRSADQEQEMGRAFALSYRTLTARQQTAFRRLGLHSGPEFTAAAAAALLGLPQDTTERLLEGLLACHLLREPVPDRYRFHDLLREYAYGLSMSEDSEQERRQAIARLTDFYVATADLADRGAYPRRIRLDARPPLQGMPAQPFPDSAAARSWLAAERSNLLAVEDQARRNGSPEQAARLAGILAGFLQSECYWQDAKKLLRHAVAHWDRSDGHASALCRALTDLCAAEASIGDYPEAAVAGERALELARRLGDEQAEAEALRVLGTLNWHLGENSKALVLLQKSFAIKSLSGDTWDKARSRNNIAVTLLFLGEREQALAHFRNALGGFREAGDKIASAQTLNNMGELQMQAGEFASARRSFEESLSFLEVDGSRYDRATARRNLAEALTESGKSAVALAIFGETLSEFRSLGDRKSQAEALVGIGEAYWRLGSAEEAGRHLLEALDIAQDIGAAHHEVQALRRLGRADFADGRLALATDRLRAAVAVAARTHDVDEETAARALLAEVRVAAGDLDEARMTLQQAFELVRHRAPVDARRISGRLTEIERMRDNGRGPRFSTYGE
ncbi:MULTISPECIES: AfsR/SARP family transcriptional regulator [unclassified Streptomyces]|uniref:AfsR/SARP family transcriptional regulator n=1 Tax=unclassified Streptomyces TaxID=2593676 RepID=UPI00081D8625|nr:tetratricopeptide repeat protein [Streptomyces sp. ScaeMP-e83]SCD78831.1 DNA-binding transcriptional activator of the SARP family [Streptomyces sp. ScaeMP-e83]